MGLVQDCSNSSALAMELLHSFTKPLLYFYGEWFYQYRENTVMVIRLQDLLNFLCTMRIPKLVTWHNSIVLLKWPLVCYVLCYIAVSRTHWDICPTAEPELDGTKLWTSMNYKNSESMRLKWPWRSRTCAPLLDTSWKHAKMYGKNLMIVAQICRDNFATRFRDCLIDQWTDTNTQKNPSPS